MITSKFMLGHFASSTYTINTYKTRAIYSIIVKGMIMNSKLRFCIAEIRMIKNWVPAIPTGSIETQNCAHGTSSSLSVSSSTYDLSVHSSSTNTRSSQASILNPKKTFSNPSKHFSGDCALQAELRRRGRGQRPKACQM